MMTWFKDAVFLARVAILPFAALVCVILWLSLRHRARFSRNSTVRMVQAVGLGVLLVALITIQLRLYALISQNQHPARDKFIFSVMITQSLVGIFLIFRTLLRSRETKGSETSP